MGVVFPYAASDLTGTFGYHPDLGDLQDVVALGGDIDLLVVGGAPDVREQVEEMRVCVKDGFELPTGLYWFGSTAGPLRMMAVFSGQPSGSGEKLECHSLPDEHALVWAREWMDSLWPDATVVPVPRFKPFDDVIVTSTGRDYSVRRRRLSGGTWVYEVRVDGRPRTLSEDMLAPLVVGDDPLDWISGPTDPASRFSATLSRAKLEGAFTDTVFSFRASRTIFRGYQFKPVIRMLETGKSRILVADEVGLGKTIEAGLIWTELEARSAADRVLVVCPAALVGKWRHEMEDRFGFFLTELSGQPLAEFADRARENRLPRRFSHVISMQRLRTWQGLEDVVVSAGPLSLAIVDEAHMMRNSGTRNFLTGTLLSEWAEAMVLLTATPINLRNQDLLNLLELLAPGEFADGDTLEMQLAPNVVLNQFAASLTDPTATTQDRLAILDQLKHLPFGRPLLRRAQLTLLKAQVAAGVWDAREVVTAKRYIADLNVLSSVLNRTRRVEVDEKKALRHAQDVEVNWTPAEQTFYTEYVIWCQARAELTGTPVGFSMQMPLRLASACLPAARDDVLRWSPDTVEAVDEDDPEPTGRAPGVRPHLELATAARSLGEGDSKFDALQDKLLRLVSQGRRGLLFTFSRPTLSYLQRRLSPLCRVAVLHGGVPRPKRHEIIADFRNGDYDLLLANQVASEGLDFEFCSYIVNYDLPWNPMQVEQRIGRIDRIGQTEDKISILNLWCPAALDEKMKQRLLDRIGVFEGTIGALEPIITEHLTDLRNVVFDFSLTEAERKQKEDQVMAAIEAQKAGLEDLESASPFLLTADVADVADIEQDILTSGRYVGPAELVRLIEDWAITAGAKGVSLGNGGRTLRLRGNRAMADTLRELTANGRLSPQEVEPYRQALMDETELHLVLDHELARTASAADLLSARHPLVLGATLIPEQRAARYAVLRVSAPPESLLAEGWYVILLGVATWASVRPGREVWGCAVTHTGAPADQAPVQLLLSALARGDLVDSPDTPPDNLDALVEAARSGMDARMLEAARRRSDEAQDFLADRRVLLEEQHVRRMSAITTRRATAHERGRTRGVDLFDKQLKRAEDGHLRTLSQIDDLGPPDLSVAHLAVCALQVHDAR